MFKSVAPLYQDALNNAGYSYVLKFNPVDENQKQKKCHTHKRNILYINPPYSQGVRTHVGAKFLKLINKHFPKSNPLSNIINRNTVNTSLTAKGALAYCLQRRTACKIQNGRQGAPKWQRGSGKVSTPRFLGVPVNFR